MRAGEYRIVKSPQIQRILFVLTRGGVGDLLLTSTLMETFKKCYPNCSVTCWINPAMRPVMENNPFADGFLEPGADASFARKLSLVKRGRFDLAVMPWSTSAQAWICALAGIPVRVGQAERLTYSFLFTHAVRVRSLHGDTTSHWVDCQLDYARILGLSIPEVLPGIWLTAEEKAGGKEFLKELGIKPGEKVVGMHLGKGMDINPQIWPTDKFAAAGKIICGWPGYRLVIMGGPKEVELAAKVEEEIGGGVLNMAGKTGLRQLAGVISAMDVLICPDSGPGHIAAAVGVPVVSIFALKEDFPNRWKPYGVPNRVIRVENSGCTNTCIKGNCRYFKCLLAIDENQVARAARELAEQRT